MRRSPRPRPPSAAAQVVLPERGCERAHWETHAWETVQPKLAAEAARASEMGEAPAPPQARRNPARVQLSDFELGEVLGEGNYSRVFLATLKTTGQQLAVKVRGAASRSARARRMPPLGLTARPLSRARPSRR